MLLISTESLKGYGLNRIFRFARDNQYDGIELALSTKDFDTQNIEYVNGLIAEYKVPVEVVRSFSTATMKKSEFACGFAKKIGAKMVILEPPKFFDFKYASWLKTQVPALRKKLGLTVALKNGSGETLFGILPGRAMNNIGDLKRFGEVCLDTAFLYSKKIDLMRAYAALKKALVAVHLSNVHNGKLHSMPTEGVLPLESLLTKLKKDAFQNPIILNVDSKVMGVGHDKKVNENLKKARDFVVKYYL